MSKTYAVMDLNKKDKASEIEATSFESALEIFCGQAPRERPFHTVRGIRMYHIGGRTIGITLDRHGRGRR